MTSESSIGRRSTWQRYLLGDVVTKFIDYRGKTPKKTAMGIPLITAKVVKNGKLLPPTEFIDAADYDSWMTRGLPEVDDVVLTTEAPLGEVALIKDKNVALAQRIITMRANGDMAFGPFLKFYFQSEAGQHELQSRASGTTVSGIKASVLKCLPVELPSLEEQKTIAAILINLDDKIDLLSRQNQTLEAMAETLFRQWFEAEAAAEWDDGTVEDLFVLQRGFDLPVQDRTNGDYPIVSSSGVSGWHNECRVQGPGVTTGRSGIIGSVYLLQQDFWPLNTSLYVKQFKRASPLFTYFFLKSMDLSAFNAGSAVPTLNRNHVHAQKAVLPPRELIERFDVAAWPLFHKVRHNEQQAGLLEGLRDDLLPKLMSGEVRVAW